MEINNQNTMIVVSKGIRKQLQIIKQANDFRNVNETIESLIASSQALTSKIPDNLKIIKEGVKK